MKKKYGLISIVIWFIVWQGAAMLIDSALFLPSPKETLLALISIGKEKAFIDSILYSLGNITKGFLGGVVLGTVLASVSYRFEFSRALFSLPVKVIRSTPVASFTILALLWVDSKNLSTLVSFLMVFPVIYTNFLGGLFETDSRLIEMAGVFKLTPLDRMKHIYAPSAFPSFLAGIRNSVGLAWKSGIAAEVIGIAKNSVGYNLNRSKVYMETENVFAWTIVTIVFSIVFEKLVVLITDTLAKRVTGGLDGNSTGKNQ